jgi:hypothetical protein
MKTDILLLVVFALFDGGAAFAPNAFVPKHAVTDRTQLLAEMDGYEKRNAAVGVLSNFMQEDGSSSNPIDSIDFDAPKFKKVPLETLAKILDYEIFNKEWFVTGNVNPIFFSDKFEFQDPDVQLVGIENYARGVNKLFDQKTSRAEIISVKVNEEKEDTITVRWRLSGKVNIGPGGGLTIKPYICITDLKVDEDGLVVFQEDEFDIPQWDILLSALFPFLIGKVTSEPAPPVEREDIPVMPKLASSKSNTAGQGTNMFDSFFGMFK